MKNFIIYASMCFFKEVWVLPKCCSQSIHTHTHIYIYREREREIKSYKKVEYVDTFLSATIEKSPAKLTTKR